MIRLKWVISLALTVLIFFSFGSCNKKVFYSDAIGCAELSDCVLNGFWEKKDYSTADSLFLNDYFIMPEYVTDSVIRFASDSNNINEIGIFHTTEGKSKEFAEMIKAYLLNSYERNQAWYDSYIPAETPKLRDAEVRIYGNYVVYAILSKESKGTAFSVAEKTLKQY